jgi:hypothetical protein
MASRQSRNSQQSYTDDGWTTLPNKRQSHTATTTDESDYDGYTPVPNHMRQSSRVSRQKPAHPLLRRRTPVSRSNSRSQSSNRKTASKKTPKADGHRKSALKKNSSRRRASARESGPKKNVGQSSSSRRYPATPGLQQQHSNSSSNRGSSQRSRPSPHLITTECFSSPDCTGIWIKVPQNMIHRAIPHLYPHLYAPKGPSKPTPKPLNFDSDDNSVFEELNRKPLAHPDWEKMLGKHKPKLPFGLKGLSEAWQEAHPGWRDGRYDVNKVAPTKDEVSVSPKEVIDPLKLQVSHRRFGGPGEREREALAAQERQELARNDILYRGIGGRY